MDGKKLLRLLLRIGYTESLSGSKGKGSHKRLTHAKYPTLTFQVFSNEVPAMLVKKILTKDVGLSLEQAKEVARGKFSSDHLD